MFDLLLPLEGLQAAEDRPEVISGAVWLAIDGSPFPGADWVDYPLSVLGSFRGAINELKRGEVEADFYFFDGPYFVRLERRGADSGIVLVTGVCDRNGLVDGSGIGVAVATADSSLVELEDAVSSGIEKLRKWAVAYRNEAVIDVLGRLACTGQATDLET